MQFCFFMKNMLGKILGFGRMHENNFFLKRKINLNVFEIFFWKWFFEFFLEIYISEKIGYFNTGFVFYNVNIQPDIMQNL